MLLSQQRLTARIGDIFASYPKNSGLFRWYVPEGNQYLVGSAREGIRQILSHAGVKRVGIPAYTCHVVRDAVHQAGSAAVFYDSGVIAEVNEIKKIINRVDAIILCYNYGLLPDIIAIADLCKKHKVVLIEDCAQAFGAKFGGKLVGSFGDYAVYSFGISKNIGFCGGLILSSKEMKLSKLRPYPKRKLYSLVMKVMLAPILFNRFVYPLFFPILSSHLHQETTRLNYAFPSLAKKAILHQLNRYDMIMATRARNYLFCKENIKVVDSEWSDPARLYLTLRVKNRDELRKRLLKEGVDMGEMLTFHCLDGVSPKARKAEEEVLTFALYRPLWEVKYLVKVLSKVLSDGSY